MTDSQNGKLISRLFDEVWNQQKLAVIEEIFTPDFRFHAGSTVLEGREPLRQALAAWQQGFPDIRHTMDEVIDAGDRVVVRWHGEGTQTGISMRLAPGGRRMDYSGITILGVREGQLAACWVSADLKRPFDCIQVYSDKQYTEADFDVDFNGPARRGRSTASS
jgi:predicted ester cyclase